MCKVMDPQFISNKISSLGRYVLKLYKISDIEREHLQGKLRQGNKGSKHTAMIVSDINVSHVIYEFIYSRNVRNITHRYKNIITQTILVD